MKAFGSCFVYRSDEKRILNAEVFFLERRRDSPVGAVMLAGLVVTALSVWLLWSVVFGSRPDTFPEGAVLVEAEREEYAHG